jgi:hypothetical protein
MDINVLPWNLRPDALEAQRRGGVAGMTAEFNTMTRRAQAAEEWFSPGRFAALLAVLIAACFPQMILGDETFYFRDFGLFTYPLAFYHHESFWRGELPLWNPFNDCGLPFLAQWNTLTLYPLSLVYLVLPLPWSLGLFSLLHLWLGGMGMYFLARHWTGSRLAGAVGGIIFGFNGLTWYALMWTNNTAALGWMPWVVLAMDLAWRRGGRAVAVAGLAGAMQMLAGAPEVILLTWLALGAFWLMRMWEGEAPRIRLCLRFIAAWALVVALAAVQLFPFLDLLRNSQRNTSFGDAQWAMPVTGCLNYLVPLFHMQPSETIPYSQPGQYWTGSYYLGVGAVLLALAAVWRARGCRVGLLAGLAVFGVLIAMGANAPAYPLLKRVLPQLGLLRFPIKSVVLPTFAIPLLAANGVAWLQTVSGDRWRGERRNLVILTCSLVACIGLIALFARATPRAPHDPATFYDVHGTLLSAVSRAVFLAAITGLLAALLGGGTARRQEVLGTALIVVLWLDVFTHCPNLSPTVEASAYDGDSIRDHMASDGAIGSPTQLDPGNSRGMPSALGERLMLFATLRKPDEDLAGRRLALFSDDNLLDHFAKVDGFYSLYLREADALTVWLYTATNGLEPLKDFLGVSMESRPDVPVEWTQRRSYMPMLSAGQQPMFVDDSTAFHAVIGDRFDPRKIVYLPIRAKGEVEAAGGVAASVTNQQFAAQRVSADVTAAAPVMLVIAQAWYHDWHAYVDGKAVPLQRANYAYQAVDVPAGRHHVTLAYEDRALHWGAAVSLGALAAAGIWFAAAGRKSALEAVRGDGGYSDAAPV